jgi:hypothetical protein
MTADDVTARTNALMVSRAPHLGPPSGPLEQPYTGAADDGDLVAHEEFDVLGGVRAARQ